ncbi:hypothetical protein M422DRAFT_49064 [Sphaerobolus stellatus SS14]|uniref:Uncharacterized protein n=1 Tax=Sphaerobolus stellatus (strain SS14) TaxID=990650 RepID=A0A0C9VRW3_SPHS4|nr:hypothetical protein M422DRAFT_49064 [Sphaerobolus stellatus SS14]
MSESMISVIFPADFDKNGLLEFFASSRIPLSIALCNMSFDDRWRRLYSAEQFATLAPEPLVLSQEICLFKKGYEAYFKDRKQKLSKLLAGIHISDVISVDLEQKIANELIPVASFSLSYLYFPLASGAYRIWIVVDGDEEWMVPAKYPLVLSEGPLEVFRNTLRWSLVESWNALDQEHFVDFSLKSAHWSYVTWRAHGISLTPRQNLQSHIPLLAEVERDFTPANLDIVVFPNLIHPFSFTLDALSWEDLREKVLLTLETDTRYMILKYGGYVDGAKPWVFIKHMILRNHKGGAVVTAVIGMEICLLHGADILKDLIAQRQRITILVEVFRARLKAEAEEANRLIAEAEEAERLQLQQLETLRTMRALVLEGRRRIIGTRNRLNRNPTPHQDVPQDDDADDDV